VLEKLSADFLTRIGGDLREKSKGFVVYQPVYDAYRHLMEGCAKKPSLQAISVDNLSLWACIARLWQRPFQFRNLIRAILGYTPTCHPDWQDLVEALANIEVAVSQIDDCERERTAGPILAEFKKLVDQRDNCQMTSFIQHFRVQKEEMAVHFFVFLDKMAIVESNASGKHRINWISLAETMITRQALASVVVTYRQKCSVFRCQDGLSRDELISVIDSARLGLDNDKGSLVWVSSCDSSALPPREGHSMFYADEALWIYGGRDRNGRVHGDIHKVVIEGFQVSRIFPAFCPLPRLRFGWAVHEKTFYIYGGTVNDKSAMSDFWSFDLVLNTWRRLKRSGTDPPATIGCVLVALRDHILFVAQGYSLFRFEIANERWEQITGSPIPLSLWASTGFLIGSDAALVPVGAEDVEILCIRNAGTDIQKISATRIPSIVTRKRGKGVELAPLAFVAVGHWLFVFGDAERMQAYGMPLASETQKWMTILPPENQAFLLARSSFALCAVDINLWIHGGVMKSGEINSSLYQIQVMGADQRPVLANRMAFNMNRLKLVQLRMAGPRDAIREEHWRLTNQPADTFG
jgi:hypothetical protein